MKIRRNLSTLVTTFFLLSQLSPAIAVDSSEDSEPDSADSSPIHELTLSDFGGSLSEGSFPIGSGVVEGQDLTRQWKKGDQIENILTAGDIESLGPQDLTLNQISQLSGTDLSQVKVGDVPLVGKNSQRLDSIAGKDLTELNETVLSKIPELKNMPIKDLEGWRDEVVAKIPGLDEVPLSAFSAFPNKIPVATFDVAFGKSEKDSTYKVISGSNKNDYSDPCEQPNCAYTELTGLQIKGGDGNIDPMKGARWIVGGWDPDKGEMLTEGGSGPLGKLFGGKEPTGRPLGKDFKLILIDTNESEGTASYGLSFRFCKTIAAVKTCTPFVFGPFPLGLTAKEGGLVFLGFEDEKTEGEDLEVEISEKELESANEALKAKGVKGSIDAFGGSITNASGSSGGNKTANSCETNILSASDKANSSVISEVLKIGQKQEFTQGQAAILLAHAESSGELIASNTLHGHRKTIQANRADLVAVPHNNGDRFEGLQPEVADAWIQMEADARADGINIQVGDTFREFSDQEKLFADAVARNGGSAEEAARTSAPPGYTEHATGFAIDIRTNTGLVTEQKDPAAYQWLQANMGNYGFEQSFLGDGHVVREDWHLRYIKSPLGLQMMGISRGSGVNTAIDTITQHVTKSKADFYGAAEALNAKNARDMAEKAAKYQSILDDCFFAGGGGCDGQFVNPHPGGHFTSPYGMRLHPILGTWKLHAGVDMSSGGGAKLVAPCGGKASVAYESGYGNVVLIDIGDKTIRIAHVAHALVKEGQVVSKGQPVAIEGNTGAGTAAHSHTEVRIGDRWGQPENPEKYIKFK